MRVVAACAVLVLLVSCQSAGARTLPPAKGTEVARPGVVATEVPLFDDNEPSRIEHPGAAFVSVHSRM